MFICALCGGCSLHPSLFPLPFRCLFFQTFQMSSSEFHEKFKSKDLRDFRLGTVASSDHETPLTGTWSAPPDCTLMPNAHWRAATQARIGCINIPQNIKCRLKTNGGSSCEATLDQGGTHSQLCKMGPARMRPRRAVQTTLGGLLRSTGAHVDLERALPELFTWHGQKCTEARLDAAIRWPTSLHTTVVDITVRCPHASRYGGGVTASPTAAGEDEKHKRYGPQVTPVAFSTYGRLGREGRIAMEALAAEARWNSGDPSNQRSQVAKWRNTLEQSLLHAQADVLLLSLGAEGCAGWQKRAGTRLGRQRAAALHAHKLSDEQVATIQTNRVLAEARRDALQAQREPGETDVREMAKDDPHEPFAEVGHLQYNLDKDLTTSSSSEPPAALCCSNSNQLRVHVPLTSACRARSCLTSF